MRYEGKVYRPWPEANALLIQVTLGCTNNNCTFCNMFRDKRFSIRKLEEVYQDIEMARHYYRYVESIFLIDGNVMALKTDTILKVLAKVRDVFPECQKISMYAGYNDLRRKSVDDLKALKEAGLDMVYVGFESGDPVVLERIKKGLTREQIIEGSAKAKEAGIRILASYIFGLGGRDRSKEHIEATTELLNIVQPEEVAPMALAIQPGTELEQELRDGSFVMPTQKQVLEEERYHLENLNFETFYWGDHGNNMMPIKGPLPQYQDMFLKRIEKAIAEHPVSETDELVTYAW